MENNIHMEGMSGAFFGLGFGLFALSSILMIILMILSILLKAYALWTAVKRDEKGWFVALLIINTLGILELVYLYGVAGKTIDDFKSLFKKNDTSVPPSAPLQ
jgi:methionyl-tRNA synthetase